MDLNEFKISILPCIKVAFQKLYRIDKELIDRGLYEVCITYKLAHYFEIELEKSWFFNKYQEISIDFEYDKYWENKKHLEGLKIDSAWVRPDIILHRRNNIRMCEMPKDNILVIEVKKDKNSNHDEDKIKVFMKHPDFNYTFGLLIGKLKKSGSIKLYYKNKDWKIIISKDNYFLEND